MRTKAVIIRCTEAEHAQLHTNKQRSELARWLRELGLSQASSNREHVPQPKLPPEEHKNAQKAPSEPDVESAPESISEEKQKENSRDYDFGM